MYVLHQQRSGVRCGLSRLLTLRSHLRRPTRKPVSTIRAHRRNNYLDCNSSRNSVAQHGNALSDAMGTMHYVGRERFCHNIVLLRVFAICWFLLMFMCFGAPETISSHMSGTPYLSFSTRSRPLAVGFESRGCAPVAMCIHFSLIYWRLLDG